MNTVWILYTLSFLMGLSLVLIGILTENIMLLFLGAIIGIVLFLTKNHVK